jgi:hypothetical protein
MKIKLLFPSLALAGIVFSSFANTYTVTSSNDTGPNSLRAVITTANGTTGPHTITFGNTGNFAGGGTINLASALPQITQSVTITGWRNDGSTNNAISINGSKLVFANGTVNTLQQLNIGGSIYNGQSLTVSGCAITSGGIQSTGILQVASSSVVGSPTAGVWNSGNATLNNVSVSLCSGGGIFNAGAMSIAGSQIFNNISPTNGAGIYSTNSLQMTGCQVVGNVTTNGTGGGIFNSGVASIFQTVICSNLAYACFGGGIYDSGQLSLVTSLVAQNTVVGQSPPGSGSNGGGAGGFGGGVFVAGNQVSLTNTTLFGNIASGGAGGLGFGGAGTSGNPGASGAGSCGGAGGSVGNGNGGNGNSGGFASGGGGGGPGYYNGGGGGAGGVGGGGGGGGSGMNGTGGAGGGGGLWGGAGGAAPNGKYWETGGGGGGAGLGGAIFVSAGSVQVVNCTLAGNQSGGGKGGGVYGRAADGHGAAAFYNYGGSVSLFNTIIASNSSATSDPADVYGAFTSQGYNFIGNTTGSSGWDPVWDYQNATPLDLGSLQNNGGPTLTCALLPGSLCILGGTSTGAPVTDQRGIFRPSNQCDIGAYQYTTLLVPVITWTNPVPIVYGTALSATQLNASSSIGGSFAYTPPVGTILNAGSNQALMAVFTPADPNTAMGATNTVLLTVQMANQAIAFPGIPTQSVNAAPITLTATASSGLPVSYSLDSGPALLAGNLLSVTGTPGQVTVRASQSGNTNFNAAADVVQSFLVVSNSMPLITGQPTNLTVNVGSDAAFSVSSTTLPLNYQWYFNGLSLAGATNATLLLPRTTTNVAGPYKVIICNPVGSVTSVVAVLTVLAPTGVPQITSQPQSKTIRAGESTSFTVSATGNATLLYQWYQGASPNTNGLISGATGTAYSTPAILTNKSYWVSVRNSLGMVDSLPTLVTVLPTQTPKLTLQITSGYPVVWLDGKVGTNYVIQYKNSLTDATWTPLLNFNMSANPFTYFDTSAGGVPRRFYRAYAN